MVQETLSLRFRSCFLKFGTYGLALVNQFFDSDFCLAGVPLRVTFADYESAFSKPRMDKNKTTNPFGQTTKRYLTAAGATFQNYESEFPRLRTEIFKRRLEVLNLEFSDYVRTQNPATKPKFAWAKKSHEITKLAGVQYAACSVSGALSATPCPSCPWFGIPIVWYPEGKKNQDLSTRIAIPSASHRGAKVGNP